MKRREMVECATALLPIQLYVVKVLFFQIPSTFLFIIINHVLFLPLCFFLVFTIFRLHSPSFPNNHLPFFLFLVLPIIAFFYCYRMIYTFKKGVTLLGLGQSVSTLHFTLLIKHNILVKANDIVLFGIYKGILHNLLKERYHSDIYCKIES